MDNITERLNGIEEAIKNLSTGSVINITDWIDSNSGAPLQTGESVELLLSHLLLFAGLDADKTKIINIIYKASDESDLYITSGISEKFACVTACDGNNKGNMLYKLVYMEVE